MTAARPTVVIGCVAKDVSRGWPKLPATLCTLARAPEALSDTRLTELPVGDE